MPLSIVSPATPLPAQPIEVNGPFVLQPATAAVLLVDSEAINRRLIKGILKAAPYRILECGRASDAMRSIETEAIHLIIVDLMLPEMGGPAFCQWLKANRKTQLIPVLM